MCQMKMTGAICKQFNGSGALRGFNQADCSKFLQFITVSINWICQCTRRLINSEQIYSRRLTNAPKNLDLPSDNIPDVQWPIACKIFNVLTKIVIRNAICKTIL
ncbi:uncharacterized protein LOC120359312 [Solenopsis invicta]|uniref:uncharacterized protein LOC120359312 n=1 Tax=Solenopsis invicta TaxID=13686 RepID=UPI00193E8488|nr:uncharacterized protein LOC120359312 [Solenopsis invicta]